MNRKLVIVDDNRDMKGVYEHAFENSGFDLVVITSSLEAQSYLDKNAVDAVLIDLAMPEMDGLTLAKQIRINEDKNGNKNRARLAWFTGRNIGEVERRVGRRVGIEETFTKPKDPYELVRDVRAWLNTEPPQKNETAPPNYIYQQNGAAIPLTVAALILFFAVGVTVTFFLYLIQKKDNEFQLLIQKKDADFQTLMHQQQENHAYKFTWVKNVANQIQKTCQGKDEKLEGWIEFYRRNPVRNEPPIGLTTGRGDCDLPPDIPEQPKE